MLIPIKLLHTKYLLSKVIELVLFIPILTVTNNANGIKGNGYGQNAEPYHPLFNHDTTHRGKFDKTLLEVFHSILHKKLSQSFWIHIFLSFLEIPNTYQNHAASSTSFANIRFGKTGSYKSFTEHPYHKRSELIQRKFPNQQHLKTTAKPLSKENEFRSPRAITR